MDVPFVVWFLFKIRDTAIVGLPSFLIERLIYCWYICG